VAITYRVQADWNNDGFFCKDARPGNALNIIRNIINPLNIDSLLHQVGDSTITFSSLATDYGTKVATWQLLSAGGSGMNIGTNGVSYNFGSAPGVVQTFVIWVRVTSATGSTNFTFTLRNQAGTTVASVVRALGTGSTAWQQVAVSGTMPVGTTNVLLNIQESPSAAVSQLQFTGYMLLTNPTSTPTGYNTGVTTDLYENLTGYVQTAQWNVGFRRMYDHMADLNKLTLTLDNQSKIFSPEYASGALFGKFLPKVKFEVYATSSGVSNKLMWRGYFDRVEPQPGVNSDRRATITATGLRRFMIDQVVKVGIQSSKTALEIINSILATLKDPNNAALSATSSGLFGSLVTSTYSYANDNWRDGVVPLEAIAAVANAEDGKFFENRSGALILWRGDYDYSTNAFLTAEYDPGDDFPNGMKYRYGDEISNTVTVLYYPRKFSSTTDKLLWELDATLTLAAGETRKITARFSDESKDKTVGGDSLSTAGLTTSGAGVTATLSASYGQSVEITFVNAAGVSRDVTALQIKGRKITTWNWADYVYSDSTSISTYGEKRMRVNYELIDTHAKAAARATREVSRFKNPRGRIDEITLIPRTTTIEDLVLNATMGNSIKVDETQTGHSKIHFIIGEEFRVSMGKTEVRWRMQILRGSVNNYPL
jgi:hypothetical protein